MKIEKYFSIEESARYNRYLIKIDYDKLPCRIVKGGSYNILPARVLNMNYPTYLRMCRDLYGAELIGKYSKYIVPYFTNKTKAKQIVDILNAQMTLIMLERRKKDEVL